MRRLSFLTPDVETTRKIVEDLVRKHHPDAEIEGTEPHIPAFP